MNTWWTEPNYNGKIEETEIDDIYLEQDLFKQIEWVKEKDNGTNQRFRESEQNQISKRDYKDQRTDS